jgi:DNA polymerase-3 subunit alpha
MKANFPAIYMSAVLTADAGDVEKIGEFIAECKRMNIPVLPPSVNESFSDFTVVKIPGEPDTIRFGLTTIKNFGEAISKAIIENRKKDGKFKSLEDFLGRITDKNLNKRSLEALIKTGALDEFGERGRLLANMENLLKYNKEIGKQPDSQDSLFGLFDGGDKANKFKLDDAPTASKDEVLLWEKELLGLYISGHPLDKWKAALDKQKINIKKIKEETESVQGAVDKGQPIAGIVTEIRIINTKKNDQMAFMKIADLSDTIEVVVFPKTFAQYKTLLVPDKCIVIIGKISDRNGEIGLIAEKMKAI